MSILLLYKQNLNDFKKYAKNLEDAIHRIDKINLLEELSIGFGSQVEYRKDYPLGERINKKESIEKKDKKFCSSISDGDYRLVPENAQKFYLYYHFINKKIKSPFGYIIGYELPYVQSNVSGGVDLVAYDDEKNVINLIEMKNCANGISKDSEESIIRPILEITTYTKCLECARKENDKLDTALYEKIKEYIPNFDKNKLKEAKLQKCILIPKSLYIRSKNSNAQQKIIAGYDYTKDVDVYFFELKNKYYNSKENIESLANIDELIFNIWQEVL